MFRRGLAIHAKSPVLIPGSTGTHAEVNVAAPFGQKMFAVWAYFDEVVISGSVAAEPR